MNITTLHPLMEKNIVSRIDKLLDEDFLPTKMFSDMKPFSESNWRPSVDIFENKNQIILKFDVPGMSSEDIDIKVDDIILTISGEKKFGKKKEEREYHCIERSHGAFSRSFKLPGSADPEKVKANYDKGVLRLEIAKRESEQARKIKIKVEK